MVHIRIKDDESLRLYLEDSQKKFNKNQLFLKQEEDKILNHLLLWKRKKIANKKRKSYRSTLKNQ